MAATEDADPTVRAAALEALGKRGEADEEIVAALLRGLLDPADPVKVEAAKALPRLAGATEAVIDGLCACSKTTAAGYRSMRRSAWAGSGRRPAGRARRCYAPPRRES